jgi:hypothetical protein
MTLPAVIVMVPAGEAGWESDRPKRTACLQFTGSIPPLGKKKTNLAESAWN